MNKLISMVLAFLFFGMALNVEACKLSKENPMSLDEIFKSCPKNEKIYHARPWSLTMLGWNKIGLSDEMVENIVIGRLRAENLYGSLSETTGVLDILITIYEERFNVSPRYKRKLYDPDTLMSGFATTWDGRDGGTHGGSSYYVLSVFLREFDRFMTDYLHVRNSEEYKMIRASSP